MIAAAPSVLLRAADPRTPAVELLGACAEPPAGERGRARASRARLPRHALDRMLRINPRRGGAAAIAAQVLLVLLAAVPAAADPPALTAELLVAHPGLAAGEFDAVREDWLVALEAEPDSPLALAAARLLGHQEGLAVRGLDPARLEALLPRVPDGRASLELRGLLHTEVRRRRFSEEPHPLPGDLYSEFVRGWRVLGPVGPLDDPAPLYADPPPPGPERELRASYPAPAGGTLRWRPLERPRNQSWVRPDNEIYPDDGGLGYLLAFVRPAGLAAGTAVRLEVLTPGGEFRASWNGVTVMDRPAEGPHRREERFEAPVVLGPGWNALLISFANGRGGPIGARLLDAGGAVLALEEAPWDGGEPPAFAASGAPAPGLPERPAAGGPFAPHLETLLEALAGRADRALAAEPPSSDPASLGPWLRVRHLALVEARHLPAEVLRRLKLEVETRLGELDLFYPEVQARRLLRLLDEDQPLEALATAEALVAHAPENALLQHLRNLALMELDLRGSLARPEMLALVEREPELAPALLTLADLSERRGDPAGALELGLRALAADGNQEDARRLVFQLLERGTAADGERLERWLAAWRAEQPGDSEPERWLARLWRRRGDPASLEALEELLREETHRRPHHPGAWSSLASYLTGLTEPARDAEALEAWTRVLALDPGWPRARRTAAHLGGPDEVRRFFETFAPDVEEAVRAAAAEGIAGTASVIEALDAALIYYFPDGSSHRRTHTYSIATTRGGTETLHESPAFANTRVARVIDAGGEIFEPILVDDAWVWPSLDPGDAVEMVHDSYRRGIPGRAPDPGGWRFTSFEKPFVRSRYVVFLPDGMAGEWRAFHYDGLHEEIPFAGGTVHVWLTEDRPRQPEEPARPSYEEILPWLQYGEDRPLDPRIHAWRASLGHRGALPADVRAQLESVLTQRFAAMPASELPAALYDFATAHVLEFESEGDVTDVWTLRRGDPLLLLAALWEVAGIEHEWALLEDVVAPELHPEPVVAFEGQRGFSVPCLRLPGRDGGAPTWVILPPGARGLRFGRVPDELAGVRVLVLGAGGERFEEIPRALVEDSWALDLEVTYALQEDGSARVSGRFRVSTAEGAVLREQIAQLEPQQRAQAARSLVGGNVPGLDLERWDFPGLSDRGGDFVLTFEGRAPRFLRGRGAEREAALGLPSPGLSTGLGAAERTWPLALRIASRTRARIRLEPGPSWQLGTGPAPFAEERRGFRYALDVTEDAGSGARTYERVLEFRGLWLEPEEMPGFLERVGNLEREERRPVAVAPN